MQETSARTLVYSRIDSTRRKIRLLLISFVVALFPVVSLGAAFIFPLIHLMYASVWPAAAGTSRLTHLGSLLWLYGAFYFASLTIAALVLVAISVTFISGYGSSFVLRLARARPLEVGEAPDLVGVVEKLCTEAGLRPPQIHLIESAAPNAFATGRNPDDASLVVTRGLLGLLDRRELEGVIAHELCHIGNHDTGSSTMLAVLTETLSLPLKLFAAPLRFAFDMRGAVGAYVIGFFLVVLFAQNSLLMAWWTISDIIDSTQMYLPGPPNNWWSTYALIVPLYVVFGAPLLTLLIRQAVFRQRNFLADAGAARLTRDPEALALALVKVGAVGGEQPEVGQGTVHSYFVDTMSKGSWLDAVFPSHPPLKKRVERVAGMGHGIAPSAILAARDQAARVRFANAGAEDTHPPSADPPHQETASSTETTERTGFGGFMRLYDRPVGGSRLLALVPEDAVLKLGGREGDFVRVTTEDGMPGYLFKLAPPGMEPAADTDRTLTPLYERPDGWSRVLAHLPESAVVTPVATVGHFIQVTTPDQQAGYVPTSAPLAAIKDFQAQRRASGFRLRASGIAGSENRGIIHPDSIPGSSEV